MGEPAVVAPMIVDGALTVLALVILLFGLVAAPVGAFLLWLYR
jgi:hypothetical protein